MSVNITERKESELKGKGMGTKGFSESREDKVTLKRIVITEGKMAKVFSCGSGVESTE